MSEPLTFRQQAAIAALQGLAANAELSKHWDSISRRNKISSDTAIATAALALADALVNMEKKQ